MPPRARRHRTGPPAARDATAFAEAGPLKGRKATTCWAHAEEMRRRHPDVGIRGDLLHAQDGRFLAFSGYAAGIDLCLYIIRTDQGAAIADEVARLAPVDRLSSPGPRCRPSAAPPAPTPAAGPYATSTGRSP